MAATKGMSASTTDGFTVFIGPSPPSACGGRDVDRQMVLNNPSVWQFTHAEHGEKGVRDPRAAGRRAHSFHSQPLTWRKGGALNTQGLRRMLLSPAYPRQDALSQAFFPFQRLDSVLQAGAMAACLRGAARRLPTQ
jgi:hypothetical protein